MDDVYPCIIIKDRYTGAYSKGIWTAWKASPWKEDTGFFNILPEDIDGGDGECDKFWHEYTGIVGKGNTPQEAYDDLCKQVEKEEKEKEDGRIKQRQRIKNSYK